MCLNSYRPIHRMSHVCQPKSCPYHVRTKIMSMEKKKKNIAWPKVLASGWCINFKRGAIRSYLTLSWTLDSGTNTSSSTLLIPAQRHPSNGLSLKQYLRLNHPVSLWRPMNPFSLEITLGIFEKQAPSMCSASYNVMFWLFIDPYTKLHRCSCKKTRERYKKQIWDMSWIEDSRGVPYFQFCFHQKLSFDQHLFSDHWHVRSHQWATRAPQRI